ncbi:MAG: type II secretion system F family protein, partial [Candidatus Nanohaloarchaea archaeon]
STNSEMFEETLKLLVDGINAGGEVSSLLESSAEDIRTSLHLREEIATNVRMYSMFIMIAAVVGAPLLFGVSTYLTETTSALWASADVGEVPSR